MEWQHADDQEPCYNQHATARACFMLHVSHGWVLSTVNLLAYSQHSTGYMPRHQYHDYHYYERAKAITRTHRIYIYISMNTYNQVPMEQTFTREPWWIGGEPSALLGKKTSQVPYSFCTQSTNNNQHIKPKTWYMYEWTLYCIQQEFATK